MNDADDSPAEASAGGHATSLGEMIRAARELREIAVEELAQRLRLEPRKLRQLEQDQFDHVGPPAYVRGYLRSIAKELDVDGSALLDAYAQHGTTEPPPLADFSSRPPLQISSDSQIIRYTTAALVVVMLVLVVLWWRARVNDIDEPPPAPVDDMTETVPATPLDATVIARNEFDLVLESEIGSGTMAADAQREPVAGTAPDATADEVAETPPAENPTMASGGAGLSLSAAADAWVEVRDGAGTRLYYGTLRNGRTVDLEGPPPYSLVIGNIEAVTLRYLGESIDLLPHSNEGVARLTLEAPPPVTP